MWVGGQKSPVGVRRAPTEQGCHALGVSAENGPESSHSSSGRE